MSTNIGPLDGLLRSAIGLSLIAFAVPFGFPPSAWNWIGWLGVLPLMTAACGHCPAYRLLGWTTAAVAAG